LRRIVSGGQNMRKRSFNKINIPSAAGGFTLVEISVVIVILGLMAAISYPSVSGSYSRSRLSSSCLQIVSALKTARGLSVTSSDNRSYGVVFLPSGRYRIYSFPSETLIDQSNYNAASIAVPYGESYEIDSSVSIANFQTAVQPFFVIFRDDGLPSADGVNIPLPDEASAIKLISESVSDELVIKISKSTGIAEVR